MGSGAGGGGCEGKLRVEGGVSSFNPIRAVFISYRFDSTILPCLTAKRLRPPAQRYRRLRWVASNDNSSTLKGLRHASTDATRVATISLAPRCKITHLSRRRLHSRAAITLRCLCSSGLFHERASSAPPG